MRAYEIHAKIMRKVPVASFAFLLCIFDKFRHAALRNRFSVRSADNSRIDLLIIRINFTEIRINPILQIY